MDRSILEAERWDDLASKGFDDPRRFGAFLHTLQWNSVTATDPNLFQAPFRAGIKIDAYQMEPLRQALRLPRVNLFIADDTGPVMEPQLPTPLAQFQSHVQNFAFRAILGLPGRLVPPDLLFVSFPFQEVVYQVARPRGRPGDPHSI